MKRKTFTLLFVGVLFGLGTLNAQVILEENFDFDANRPLILDPLPSSVAAPVASFDAVTGWSTVLSSNSSINTFNITEAPLTYNGYTLSGIGKAVKCTGLLGQSVFKPFSKAVKNDSTVYISFLINIPSSATITSADYFMAVRMDKTNNTSNYGCKVWAAVDPSFVGSEVSLGINKLSSTAVWDNNHFFAANTTHLFVVKYYVGKLIGTTATEETNKYDDVMSVFVNPSLTGVEPTTPTLSHADATIKDMFRYDSTNKPFGSLAALWLRTKGSAGDVPAYTIDGIRVGVNWADVIPVPNGLKQTTADNFYYSVKQTKLSVTTSLYKQFELLSLSGQQLLKGSLLDGDTSIDVSSLKKGVYILSLQGAQKASAKIIIP